MLMTGQEPGYGESVRANEPACRNSWLFAGGESSLFVGVEMGGGKVTKEGGIAFFSPH